MMTALLYCFVTSSITSINHFNMKPIARKIVPKKPMNQPKPQRKRTINTAVIVLVKCVRCEEVMRSVIHATHICADCKIKRRIEEMFQFSTNIVEIEWLFKYNRPEGVDPKKTCRLTCTKGVDHFVIPSSYRISNTSPDKYNCQCDVGIAERRKDRTCLKKYGFINPMQHHAVRKRQLASAYRLRDYKWPSKSITQCHGYDRLLFDHLLTMYIEEEIDIENKISFEFINHNGTLWAYFPDAITRTTVYAAKSLYTLKKELKDIRLQANSVIKRSYCVFAQKDLQTHLW